MALKTALLLPNYFPLVEDPALCQFCDRTAQGKNYRHILISLHNFNLENSQGFKLTLYLLLKFVHHKRDVGIVTHLGFL